MNFSKLILGTANFFNPYGVYQNEFNITKSDFNKVIDLSLEHKVTAIDTALHYGKPSDIKALQKKFRKFDIINKIKPIEKELEQIDLELTTTLLLHIDPRHKVDTKSLFDILLRAKKQKPQLKIGVSIYNAADVDSEIYDICDTVQLPISILDQNLLNSGFIEQLSSRNIEIHARSIFLQGIILNNPQNLKDKFASLAPAVKNFHAYCNDKNYSPLHVCLHFILSNKLLNFCVCGFNSYVELKQLLGVERLSSLDLSDMPRFSIDNPESLKPYNW